MFHDKLTRLALKRAHSRVATPVIIKAKPDRLSGLGELVLPYVEQMRDFFPRVSRVHDVTMPFTPYPLKILRRFDMLATTLPREVIFRLGEDSDVELIYSDEPQFAFFNTVPEEGVFRAPHRLLKEITFTSTAWTKKLMGADLAHERGFYGDGITASVCDTGASRVHEQLRRIVFKTAMKQFRDENGHGSWCTACVGGGRGVDDFLSQRSGRVVECEGVAPRCNLLAVKCLGYVIGMGSTSGIIDALDISLDHGADVISLSLGGPSTGVTADEDPYYTVMQKVVDEGVIPVVAAGNDGPGSKTVGSPGDMPSVLTVGAYDPITGKMADFSSRGPTNWGDLKPDVVAPGVSIDSAICGALDTSGDGMFSRYSPISGTSMSTPSVAGLVTLMKQAHRERLGQELTVDEIKQMMAALGMEKSTLYGWGSIHWGTYEKWLSAQYGVEL